jgi:hypothetical protein
MLELLNGGLAVALEMAVALTAIALDRLSAPVDTMFGREASVAKTLHLDLVGCFGLSWRIRALMAVILWQRGRQVSLATHLS